MAHFVPGLPLIQKEVMLFRGSGGCRKVRWSMPGTGKRGGARIIHYNRFANGEIWLLVIYIKSVKGSIPAHTLKAIREVIENE